MKAKVLLLTLGLIATTSCISRSGGGSGGPGGNWDGDWDDRPGYGRPDYDYENDYRPQRWVHVGARRVEGSRPRTYTLRTDLARGRYREVRFTVQGGELELYDVVIEFDNGRRFSPEVRHRFHAGSRSRVIELPGTVRGISRMRFVCRSMERHNEPTLSVFAR